ncbi:MAG: peptidoglycan bridge formation glycyltransferase FemA/FemB family protein, partial [bacterium]|nr:peptidoglycan bridge formation glycyltransferase FemA/FemB family protein [bacterium]
MDLRRINDKQKTSYNKLVTHVIQSWEWGEFRKSLGIPVLRYGLYSNGKLKTAFQLTLHHIPYTNQCVGYLPKGPEPDKQLAEALKKIGKEHNCAFIKIEPNIEESRVKSQESRNLKKSSKPLFTKYNFVLDLTKSEEELLKNMHPKTRYNIRVAEKHGVKVEDRVDDQAFEIYQKLYFETTLRQGYHGHNKNYHKKVWETLRDAGMARILIASFEGQPLTAWMLLNFKDTLYYPYGGSSK